MDKIKKRKQLVKEISSKYADFKELNRTESEIQMVFDAQRGHYYLMDIGWQDMERIHSCLLHLDVKADGKIWVQKDFTEQGIVTVLLEEKVPKQDIVLGFHSPFKRTYTDFAKA